MKILSDGSDDESTFESFWQSLTPKSTLFGKVTTKLVLSGASWCFEPFSTKSLTRSLEGKKQEIKGIPIVLKANIACLG